MAMSRRRTDEQSDFWIATANLAQAPGHPFYRRLNQLLAAAGFDRFAEDRCEKFYARFGRPSIPPGVYFRMLLIGYFEGIDSERGIDWRCADSLALREFLGYKLDQTTPDHSTLSIIRTRLDLETHQEIFQWVLTLLAEKGLLKGQTIGVDATTLEANAALRSIVRRDTNQRYEDFLTELAQASGIETPTREDLAKIDRKRPKKGSNDDWFNPNDPEAKIAKMKDGSTHMVHKAEHAVDLETGAIVAVTLQEADQGDTATIPQTLVTAAENLDVVRQEEAAAANLSDDLLKEVVDDKGYHSGPSLLLLQTLGIRTYTSEPKRKGKRHWQGKHDQQQAVYANRRRIKGERGKALLRKRGELVERPFAHCYETGRMRRTHLRHHQNILKRLLVHVAGCNLGLLMRTLFGLGTPRGLQSLLFAILRQLQHHYQTLKRIVSAIRDLLTNFGGWNSLFRSAC